MEPTRRLRAAPALDVASALFAAVTVPILTARIDAAGDERALDALGMVCMIAAGAALGFRRIAPRAAVAFITADLILYVARGYPGGPVFVTLFVALYSLAAATDRRTGIAAAVVAAGVLVVAGELAGTGPGLVHLVFVGWAAAAAALGDAVRSRRAHVQALAERATQLELSREEEARRRVAEERLRIARDLHDSVAHSMATISVHAGAAARVVERHPDQAREALRTIQKASGQVLDELHAMLRVLRVAGGEPVSRAPTPGLADLGALVESTRTAGIAVNAHVDDDVGEILPVIATATYRIVQESLTNVIRHSHATTASVSVGRDDEGALVVEVSDDGRPGNGATTGAGVGIIGMRERAETTGGRLSAGRNPDGGFTVTARWPSP